MTCRINVALMSHWADLISRDPSLINSIVCWDSHMAAAMLPAFAIFPMLMMSSPQTRLRLTATRCVPYYSYTNTWQCFKVSFSFHKIPKKTQMTTLYNNLSLYIAFTNFVNVSHHYWIPIWVSMYSMLKWRYATDSISSLHSCNKSFYIRRRYQVCLQPMPCGFICMYWAKYKQSHSHTRLMTLCSHFLLSLR